MVLFATWMANTLAEVASLIVQMGVQVLVTHEQAGIESCTQGSRVKGEHYFKQSTLLLWRFSSDKKQESETTQVNCVASRGWDNTHSSKLNRYALLCQVHMRGGSDRLLQY